MTCWHFFTTVNVYRWCTQMWTCWHNINKELEDTIFILGSISLFLRNKANCLKFVPMYFHKILKTSTIIVHCLLCVSSHVCNDSSFHVPHRTYMQQAPSHSTITVVQFVVRLVPIQELNNQTVYCMPNDERQHIVVSFPALCVKFSYLTRKTWRKQQSHSIWNCFKYW